MIEYKVTVYPDGSRFWYNSEGGAHREDGPAVEWANGDKSWYLNGWPMTEQAWKQALNPVKEMTVEEISQALGYDIKVVKG